MSKIGKGMKKTFKNRPIVIFIQLLPQIWAHHHKNVVRLKTKLGSTVQRFLTNLK